MSITPLAGRVRALRVASGKTRLALAFEATAYLESKALPRHRTVTADALKSYERGILPPIVVIYALAHVFDEDFHTLVDLGLVS